MSFYVRIAVVPIAAAIVMLAAPSAAASTVTKRDPGPPATAVSQSARPAGFLWD
jgi:hypothetical protein